MSDCLFCKIIAGEIPSAKVYEDEHVFAFKDILPQAPFHALIVPKRHIATLNDLEAGDAELVGKMYLAAAHIAKEQGYAESGYRTTINCNKEGGQDVFHIHLHLLAGRQMGWPPG